MADSDFCLIVNLRDERRGVDARGKLAFFQELGIYGDILVVRIHVLHTGNAN